MFVANQQLLTSSNHWDDRGKPRRNPQCMRMHGAGIEGGLRTPSSATFIAGLGLWPRLSPSDGPDLEAVAERSAALVRVPRELQADFRVLRWPGAGEAVEFVELMMVNDGCW